MWNGVYFIIVVAVAVWGIFSGFRMGFMRQMGGLLAVAFGIVGARMLAPEFIGHVEGWIPSQINGFNRIYICETLTSGLIYFVIAGFIGLCAMPLGKLMSVLGFGILNSLGGAVFRLFQFLMLVSIAYNLIADFSPAGDLTRISSRHDGNIVEGVVQMAPAILGFPGAEEVAFRQQMEDAKKIS